MAVATFDTLKFARNLRDKAKLSPEQAEGFADAIAEAMQGDLATKVDLRNVEVSLKGDFKDVDIALKEHIRDVEVSLKGDIKDVEIALRREIKDVDVRLEAVRSDLRQTELRLKADIESSKADVIKWVFGAIGFQTIIVLGAVIALARLFVK